jgi:hypothetical protein
MVTFKNNKNNNRRPPFRSNNNTFRSNNNRRPPFRRNEERSNFSNNDNFQRNGLERNNHNASKLIEKYNNLAREALANEDKTLSENYFQYADHFTRVQSEQEKNKMTKVNIIPTEVVTSIKPEEKKDIAEESEDTKSVTS